jgi:hypothetical protein
MPATPVPKLTTTLVLPWEANSTIFSASLLTCDFLMNSSLPTKPFRPHKPNILQWLLPMMLLNLLLCVVQILRLCLPDDGLRQGMFREISVPAVQASSFCGWFRLAENIKTIGIHK